MAVTSPPRRAPSLSRRANYVAIRVTGALLALLALGHFALTHIVTDVADTGSNFIERRWATTFWVAWDGLLLGAALLHAAAGLVILIRDYRHTGQSRARWVVGIVALCIALFLIGTTTLTYAALG